MEPQEPAPRRAETRRPPALVGGIAALLWVLLCLRWFDVGAAWRPAALALVPSWLLAIALAAALLSVVRRADGAPFAAAGLDLDTKGLLLLAALALFVRAPLVAEGAAGYLTSDGALSGIVALRARDAREHFVFVPAVPYSGSLKSLLTAPLAAVMDPARAFALVSVLFYVAFVAGVHRLGVLAGGPRVARWAALYAALAPAFVTQYSLSNDGNYVEVLGLGAWALVAALAAESSPSSAWGAGILLGLAFWCHILALIPALAIGLWLLRTWRRPLAVLAPLLLGWGLGYFPGLLWNLANGGESFLYLLPGGPSVGEAAASSPSQRLAGLALDLLPRLMGYVPVDGALDRPSWWLAMAAGVVGLAAVVGFAVRPGLAGGNVFRLLALLAAANIALVVGALPYLPGNPRYILFLMLTLPVPLAACVRWTAGRVLLLALLALGVLGSGTQAIGKLEQDRGWRQLASDLERLGVRHCYSDFYLATRITFMTEERLVCTAKLGPSTTEYFFEYRTAVEAAPAAAFVAVNHAQADKLERRLRRLGVTYTRTDSTRPILHGLARKVDPQELFPDRDFPLR